MCLSFNIQNFTKKSVTQVQHTGFHVGTTGRLSLKSAKGMIRPCSRPASECWQGSPKTRKARHVTENSTLRRRNRHQYRQELVPHRWPESARCHPPVPAKYVRPFAPKNGHRQAAPACLQSATSRHARLELHPRRIGSSGSNASRPVEAPLQKS